MLEYGVVNVSLITKNPFRISLGNALTARALCTESLILAGMMPVRSVCTLYCCEYFFSTILFDFMCTK